MKRANKMKRMVGESRIKVAANYINSKERSGCSLADVGCRDEILKDFLSDSFRYKGFDIYPVKKSTEYGDIQKGLETDEQYDFVTALDVLEHTDDIERSTSELLRICSGEFIINLPNELFILYRLRLLFGIVSGKFQINFDTTDRHRWFFTADNVDRFVQSHLFSDCDTQVFAYYQKSRILGFICRFLGVLGLHSLGALSFIVIGRKK